MFLADHGMEVFWSEERSKTGFCNYYFLKANSDSAFVLLTLDYIESKIEKPEIPAKNSFNLGFDFDAADILDQNLSFSKSKNKS